jgi:hypothetical protein
MQVWGEDLILDTAEYIDHSQGVALTYVEAFTLRRNDFEEALMEAPGVAARVRKAAKKLLVQRALLKYLCMHTHGGAPSSFALRSASQGFTELNDDLTLEQKVDTILDTVREGSWVGGGGSGPPSPRPSSDAMGGGGYEGDEQDNEEQAEEGKDEGGSEGKERVPTRARPLPPYDTEAAGQDGRGQASNADAQAALRGVAAAGASTSLSPRAPPKSLRSVGLVDAATAWIPKAAEAKAQRKTRRLDLGDWAAAGGGRGKVKMIFRKAQQAEEDRDVVLGALQKNVKSLQGDVSDVKEALKKLTGMVQVLLDR